VQLDEITLHFANNVIHLPSEYRAALRPRWRPRWRGFFLTVPENPVLFWSLTLAGRLSQPPHPLLKFRLTHGPVRSAVNQLPRASDTDES
jgi:hypothetical protein